MNEIDIQTIRYVCTVAQYSSFSKAADALFVTQPSLSQAIQKLENSLGFQLFTRSTRKVSLTEEGKKFIEEAEPLINEYSRFQRSVMQLKKQNTETIAVGLLPTYIELNMPVVLQSFQQTHAGTEIIMETHSSQKLLNMLNAGKIDIAVCYVSRDWIEHNRGQYRCQILITREANVLIHENNPLSKHRYISLSDLESQTVFTLEKKSALEREVFKIMQEYRISPIRTKTCPSFRNMIGIISMNQGVCFHSSDTGNEYIHAPLKSLPLMPQISMAVTLVTLNTSVSNPAADEFLKYFAKNY